MVETHEAVGTLTPAEREALRLYLKHSDVKMVARAIGVSDHAIVKRLANARAKLKVSRTIDAAVLLARSEDGPGYTMVEVSPRGPVPDPTAEPNEAPSEEGGGSWRSLFPSEGRPWNDLPTGVRLAWMSVSVLAVMAAAMLALSLLQGVTMIVRPNR